jgi:hypothetical protein
MRLLAARRACAARCRVAMRRCVLVVLAYVFPKMAIFYAICGLYDVSRNRVNVTTLRR